MKRIMQRKADVVIIGGGIIGTSCAYHLMKKGCGKVILLEKEDTLASAATGLSAGVVETQYLDKLSIELRAKGFKTFIEFRERYNISFEQIGYMRLLTEGNEDKIKDYQGSIILQREMGIEDARILSPQEVKEIIPDLNMEDVVMALWGPSDGYVDPYEITICYAKVACELGAEILTGTEARDIEVTKGKIEYVQTDKGKIHCDYVVNAAGAWAQQVGAMVGINLPIKPYKRSILVVKSTTKIPYTVPFVMDYVPGSKEEGLYFREEMGDKLLMGLHTVPDTYEDWKKLKSEEPDKYSKKVSFDCVSRISERIRYRIPVFQDFEVINRWSGLYSLTPDSYPVIGEVSEPQGFINAAGFSGSGIQLSPVAGQLVSELIMESKPSIIEGANCLGIERFF